MVSAAVRTAPAAAAERVARLFAFTRSVVTVKVADAAPAGTVTLAGTLAALLLLDSATTRPPAGAGPLNVTVPTALRPPRILVGLTVSVVSDAVSDGFGSQVKSMPVRSGPTVTVWA